MQTYPINLIGLAQRRCLVVGGGAVALRKIEGLLAAGAVVRVIARECADGVLALAAAGRINLEQRE